MPRLLPRSVLEGYGELVGSSRRRYGAPAHLMIGNYSVDEVQNEFIARSRAAGRSMSFIQHGGYYLQSRVNGQERLELRPDGTFLSWGGRAPHARPLANPKLERLRGRWRPGDDVLIVEWVQPADRYLILFASQPLANQGYGPGALLARFAGAVQDARRRPRAQALPLLRGRGVRARAGARGAAPPAAARRDLATEWMARSRLVVVPYADTPFIEAMVMGAPTIGLWDPELWELRDDARPAFEALERAGVIQRDPEAAAAHVDAVYADPLAWWDSPETRAARDIFIERFAAPGDWLAEWTAYIRAL